MTAFNILKSTHKMIGVDLHAHIQVPPWPPAPGGPSVHLVMASLHHYMESTLKEAPTVHDEGSVVMQRCTDIGSLIMPHMIFTGLDLLMPLYIATSASKSHFGASTVLAEGRPIATAVLVKANLNLDCASTVGVGLVVAPNTVRAGMTIADIVGGLLQAIAEGVASYYLSKLFGWAAKGLLRAVIKGLWPFVAKPLVWLIGKLGNKVLSQLLTDPMTAIIGDLIGGPLGYSVPHPVSDLYDKANKANDAIIKYFNGDHPTFV